MEAFKEGFREKGDPRSTFLVAKAAGLELVGRTIPSVACIWGRHSQRPYNVATSPLITFEFIGLKSAF